LRAKSNHRQNAVNAAGTAICGEGTPNPPRTHDGQRHALCVGFLDHPEARFGCDASCSRMHTISNA
jgi:hypothetical protein